MPAYDVHMNKDTINPIFRKKQGMKSGNPGNWLIKDRETQFNTYRPTL